MLKDNYNIHIIGRQTYGGEEHDEQGEISLATTGSYNERGDIQLISYKEYDEDDPKLSRTAFLKIEPGRVTMSRTGSGTKLILEKGKRHLCVYDTGFGALSVGVFTSEMNSSLSRSGGRLSVKYTLDIDSALSSSNEIEVEIRPREGSDIE